MKRILLLLTAFATLLACTKNNPNPKEDKEGYKPNLEKYGNVVLAKNVVFIDDVLAKYIDVIDESSFRIHVTGRSKAAGSYPDNMIPKAGSVIYAPVSETTPVGFMGKVKSVSESNGDYIVTTEGVDIGEVFEELDITTTLDVTEFMEAIVDEEGNEILGEDSKGELWENFAGENDPETKASTPELTRKFSIPKHPIIDGNLYITASADVHVKILFGKPEEYSIALNLLSGVEATIKMSLKGFEGTQKLLNVPIKWRAFNVGPLVVIPTTAYKVDLKLEAEASLESGFKWQFQNNTFKCFGKFGSEPKAEIINNDSSKDRYLKVLEISGEATFTFQQRLEQSISIYNDRFLKIGVNTGNDIPITFKAEVDMASKDLLKVNPSVTVGHVRNSSVFVESMFISGLTSGTNRWSIEFPSNTTREVDLLTLPALVKPTVKKEKKKITVEVDKVKPKAIVKAEESGVALFHKDNQESPIKLEPVTDFPIENCLSESLPEEKPVEKTVTFDGLTNSDEYIVKEYVKTEKGEIYYKDIGTSLVKTAYFKRASYSVKYEFSYDENGEISFYVCDDSNGYHMENEYFKTDDSFRIYQKSYDSYHGWFEGEFMHGTFDEEGNITYLQGNNPSSSTTFQYENGKLSRCITHDEYDTPDKIYNWRDDCIISVHDTDGLIVTTITPSLYEDKLNINLYHFIYDLLLDITFYYGPFPNKYPGITCKCLPESMTTVSNYGVITDHYSYTFDNSGNLIRVSSENTTVEFTYYGNEE